jgi:hypothetical protein
VQQADDQGRDAQPFVQPVHLVESAERPFDAARAQRQQQRQAHRTDSDDAAVLHEGASQREVAEGLRPQRVGQQPQEREQQQKGGQQALDSLHERSLRAAFCCHVARR